MADSGFQTIRRWATVAIWAAALSLAHAQPPGELHAASVSFRQSNGGVPGSWFAAPTFSAHPAFSSHPPFTAQPAAGLYRTAQNYPVDRRSARPGVPSRRGSGQRFLSTPPMPAGGLPYRPISGNARNMPHPSSNAAYMRAGSIRDAVTRYNEEREAGRVVPRPPNGAARAPDPSLYRN